MSEKVEEYKSVLGKERMFEMARIGNLPKHQNISVWVNQSRDSGHTPHLHLVFPSGDFVRIGLKDFELLDPETKNTKVDRNLKKEVKKWFLMDKTFAGVTKSNIEFAIDFWNDQPGVEIMTLDKVEWLVITRDRIGKVTSIKLG